jgi:hypothetical protein
VWILRSLAEQTFEVQAHLIQNQVRTLRIADQHAKLPLVVVDHEVMSAEREIEPRRHVLPAHAIDHLGFRQALHVRVERLPTGRVRPAGEMARSVGGSFVDQYHGPATIASASDNTMSSRAEIAAKFRRY